MKKDDKIMAWVIGCMLLFCAAIVLAIVLTPDSVKQRALERQLERNGWLYADVHCMT